MLHRVISCVVIIATALSNVAAGLSMEEAMNREGPTGTAHFRSGFMRVKNKRIWELHPAGMFTTRHFAKTIISSASDVKA